MSTKFTMSGQMHPLAKREYDQGRAAATLELQRVTLVLKPSEGQKADLGRLLSELHDPASKNYHKWLTPEEFADRFGLSQSDLDKIIEWLGSQDLRVTGVARARNAVYVSGTAGQFERAFATEIHTYPVNGEKHYANATEPSVPAALQGILESIHGLHDFRMKPRHRIAKSQGGLSPNYTSPSNGRNYLAPDDFATIFDIKPLHDAGIDGSGQTVVIVGQSDIDSSHVTTFRTTFGLGIPNLTTILVPNTADPGTRTTDEQESDLDLEWVSAVARGANLIFVYSDDVTNAVQYAIDENLAPVISASYGACETTSAKSDALTLQSWAQQANAQGITWVAASGDSGAAGCSHDDQLPFGGASSELVLAADLPASIPEVTAVGGTEFNEGNGAYWNSSNDSQTKASARSYIPETSWNDSTNNDAVASGGGASQLFSKPSWQTGNGVPSDSARDVPDLAFPGSADHDGYIVYTTGGFATGWYAFGGTSAGAPSFSGVLALLNQYLVAYGYQSSSGLGNVNPSLYQFASSAPSAFHDITSGDNIVTASVCTDFLCGSTKTESVGYNATAGYDQVTGLGSIDVYNFVTGWPNATVSSAHSGMRGAASTASITQSGTQR